MRSSTNWMVLFPLYPAITAWMRMQWNAASAEGGAALNRASTARNAATESVSTYRMPGLQLRGESAGDRSANYTTSNHSWTRLTRVFFDFEWTFLQGLWRLAILQ